MFSLPVYDLTSKEKPYRWSDVPLLCTFLKAARYPDSPLSKLTTEMKWFIFFTDNEIEELELLYSILEPLATLFNKLGSEKQTNIHLGKG